MNSTDYVPELRTNTHICDFRRAFAAQWLVLAR